MFAKHVSPRVDALIASVNKPLSRVAQTIARRNAEVEDLHQIGLLTALRLAPAYDPEKHCTFLSFVYLAARGAMVDHAERERAERRRVRAIKRGVRAKHAPDPKEARYANVGASILALTVDADTPEDAFMTIQTQRLLRECVEIELARLGGVERALMRAVAMGGESLAEAARRSGIEYERARYRYERALEVLGRRFASRSEASPPLHHARYGTAISAKATVTEWVVQ